MGERFERLSDVLNDLVETRDPACRPPRASIRERFEFWAGASGRTYVHSVYRLIDCPELPPCNFVVVRRNDDGTPEAARIGTLSSSAHSLNRAAIRQVATNLGAGEIHIHYLATSASDRAAVAFDIETALELADDALKRYAQSN